MCSLWTQGKATKGEIGGVFMRVFQTVATRKKTHREVNVYKDVDDKKKKVSKRYILVNGKKVYSGF